MANRIQLSLIFKDTEVFENLVVPYREARELTNLIQNLFASYYYNDRVRSIVDGFSEDELLATEASANEQFAAAAARARETLAMASALSEQMDMAIGGGLDDIMSQMNDIASKSGGSVSEDTEFGTSMPEMGSGLHDMFNAAKQNTQESAPEDWQDAILRASGGDGGQEPSGVVSKEGKKAMQRVEEVLQSQEAMKKELREDLTKLVDDKLKGVTDTLSSQGKALSDQQSALGNITQMLQSLSEGMSNLQGSMKATAVVVDDTPATLREAEPATKAEDKVQPMVVEEPVSEDKDELDDLDLFDSDDEEEAMIEEPLSGVNEEETSVEDTDSDITDEEDDGLASLQLFLDNGVAFSSPT